MLPQRDAEALQKALHRAKLTKKRHHIYVLKLIVVKFAILTFTKNLPNITIHIQISSKVTVIFLENRGYMQPKSFENQQVNSIMSSVSWACD